MKRVFTILFCTVAVLSGYSQSDNFGIERNNLEQSPELRALYQQARHLENSGTAAEINANRLAIKAAWQEIDSEIAASYKPLEEAAVPVAAEAEVFTEAPRSPEDWDSDMLIHDGFIDGLDMITTRSGDIYIAGFENFTGSGDDSTLYVYRSTDDGVSFQLFKSVIYYDTELYSIKLAAITGNGDEYLLAFTNYETSLFVTRINMATGDFEMQGIKNGVISFGVDANYPNDTSAIRVMVAYQVEDTNCSTGGTVFSARSTAGSYGFDYVDEHQIIGCGKQVDLAYGLNGSTYLVFVGGNSKSLKATANSNYNDPGSWENDETVENGSDRESLNPTIAAARKQFAQDNVIIWTSQRDAGTTDHYDGKGYKRVNGASYVSFVDFGAGGVGDWSISATDSFVRQEATAGFETIRTSYVRYNIAGSDNSTNRSLTYNGTDFDTFEPVADPDKDVWAGFPSAIAETSDGLPCVAFSVVDRSVGFPYGHSIYFDRKSDVVGVEDNIIEGLAFYPNPAHELINLSAQNAIEDVVFYSLLGQEVLRVSPDGQKTAVDVSSLAQGVYVMKVGVKGQTASYKIIKE